MLVGLGLLWGVLGVLGALYWPYVATKFREIGNWKDNHPQNVLGIYFLQMGLHIPGKDWAAKQNRTVFWALGPKFGPGAQQNKVPKA